MSIIATNRIETLKVLPQLRQIKVPIIDFTYYVQSTGQFFYYDSVDTTTPDNGSDVFVPYGTSYRIKLKVIPGVDLIDSFSLAATDTRVVPIGQTLVEIHLKPTANITVDIGTTLAGTEIQDDLVLVANETTILTFKKTADSAFTLYFTYVTGTGIIATKLIKKVY